MIKLSGKELSFGIAIGNAYVIKKEAMPSSDKCVNKEEEKKKFLNAVNDLKSELKNIEEDSKSAVGIANAEIFEIHQLMLEDEDYIDEILNLIENNKSAISAVEEISELFSKRFLEMDSEYMRERSADVLDISHGIVNFLRGDKIEEDIPEGCIVFAEELSPSQVIKLGKKNTLALVTKKGSRLSHASILAGMLNLASIVVPELELSGVKNSVIAAVDTKSGSVFIEPDENTISSIKKEIEGYKKYKEELESFRKKKTITKDNKEIMLYANISGPDDVEAVISNDAEGIGLFRTEFLYMGRKNPPSEDEQFFVYKNVLEKMQGKNVILRTFDLGSDKKADYIHFEHEENPALGMRGIRLNLLKKEMLKTQLRAAYRASEYGNILIMYPMIISESELMEVKEISKEVRKELGIKEGKVKEGIMIETPAAAIISDKLAGMVDFFSIGTNDLTQYTLACDRENPHIEKTYDIMHPAVFSLIKNVCENAHKNNIWVGVCGELAGNPLAIKKLISYGIDEISVSPSKVLLARKSIYES